MRHFKFLFLLGVMICSTLQVMGEDIVIYKNDGTKSYVIVDQSSKVLTKPDAVFVCSEKDTLIIPYKHTQKISFTSRKAEQGSSGIETDPEEDIVIDEVEDVPSCSASYRLISGKLYIKGLQSYSKVFIYKIDGRLLKTFDADSLGNAVADLYQLQSQIVVVKTSSDSFKIKLGDR